MASFAYTIGDLDSAWGKKLIDSDTYLRLLTGMLASTGTPQSALAERNAQLRLQTLNSTPSSYWATEPTPSNAALSAMGVTPTLASAAPLDLAPPYEASIIQPLEPAPPYDASTMQPLSSTSNDTNPTLVGGRLSMVDVLSRYKAGGYGAVGSEAAKTHAIYTMAQIWESTGLSAADAMTRATETFDREFGATATKDDTPPVDTKPFGPGLNEGEIAPQNPFERFLGETPGGRGAIEEEFIQQKYPTAGGPFAGYLGRQLGRQQNQYLVGAGVGQVPETTSYMDFLRSNSGIGELSAADWQNAIKQAGGFVNDPTGQTGTQTQNAFGEWLRANPHEERNLAIQSGIGGIASPFRNAFKNFATKAYNTFSYNNPGVSWLPEFVRRGYRF